MQRTWNLLLPSLCALLVTTIPIKTVAQTDLSSVSIVPVIEGVDFTPQQQRQLSQISRRAMAQIESILSESQQNQLLESLQAGQKLPDAIKSLTLSPAQETQVQQVMKSVRSQLMSTVTLKQRLQIMRTMRKR